MKSIIPEEIILKKIYLIRDRKVMLDMDLAALYGIETKQFKRAVRRNIERFPEDFMFELTKEELQNWRCQFGTSNSEKMGIRIQPFAFTEPLFCSHFIKKSLFVSKFICTFNE